MTDTPGSRPQDGPASSDSHGARNAPAEAIDALLGALARLEDAIDNEALSLGAPEPERLLDAVDAKRRALAEIETLIHQPSLEPLLRGDAERGRPPLARHPEWRQVLEKLEACHVSNEAVGGALSAARASTEASLKWLGLAAETDTYGDAGGPNARGRDLAVC